MTNILWKGTVLGLLLVIAAVVLVDTFYGGEGAGSISEDLVDLSKEVSGGGGVYPPEQRAYDSAGEIFISRIKEDGSSEFISRKKGIVIANISFITIFDRNEFFPLERAPEDSWVYWQTKEGVEMRFGTGNKLVEAPWGEKDCAVLLSQDIICQFNVLGITPSRSSQSLTFNTHDYFMIPTYKELVANKDSIYLFVAGVWRNFKIQGRFVENSWDALRRPPDAEVTDFMVDFGGISQLDRMLGASVWMKNGSEYKLIGLVSEKTNFGASVVIPYKIVLEHLWPQESEETN